MTLWIGNGAVLKSSSQLIIMTSWIGNGAVLKSSSQLQLKEF